MTTLLSEPLPPFRLDLTAWALQRRPGNLIDRWDGAAYHRVLVVNGKPYSVSVVQRGRMLEIGTGSERPGRGAARVIKREVETALGVHVNLRAFYRLAAQDSRLGPLARRFRGLKPPQFPSVFEGLINGIACQQLSLSVGIRLLGRLAQNFGLAVREGHEASYAFPRPQDLAGLTPEALRKLGFNFQKSRAIVEVSRAIVEGRLDLEGLKSANDEEALQTLIKLRGVGRWTAELTMLRGMGRIHIFPADDLGARNGLARWLRLRKPLDSRRAQRIMARWKPYGGLIYFHMLMSGLDAAGQLSPTGVQPHLVE